MKKKWFALLLLCAALLTSCGIYSSYGFDYRQLAGIERGMTFKEVCAILGDPAFRDINAEDEAWTFRAYSRAGWAVVKVWFKEGKVTLMKSYLEDTCPVQPLKDSDSEPAKPITSGTKVGVSSDGKHYVDTGSVVVTSDGKHYIKMGSVVVTPEGKHIIIP